MVIKKSNSAARIVLDMLSRPVEDDDEEFLDELEKKKTFMELSGEAPQDLSKLTPKMNADQEAMLAQLADVSVNEEDLDATHPKEATAQPPQEISEKERRFFNLFKTVGSRNRSGASVPDDIDFSKIKSENVDALPRVADTEQEKEAKAEDLERRQAWIERNAMLDEKQKSSEVFNKSHEAFVNQFDQVLEKR